MERSAEGSRFADALRSARRRMIETGHPERGEEAPGLRPGSPRKPGEDRKATSGPAQEGGPREERRGSPPAATPTPGALVDAAPAGRAVASIVRALPVAIAAACASGGGALALSFGRSLDVELSTGPSGVDLVLRPEPRLLAAIAAELPRIVAALRARGVSVGRAEVRAGGSGPRPRRAR